MIGRIGKRGDRMTEKRDKAKVKVKVYFLLCAILSFLFWTSIIPAGAGALTVVWLFLLSALQAAVVASFLTEF